MIPNSFNEFEHLQGLLGPEFREIARPNNDMLFSAAWLDLRNELVIIEIPSICERYFQSSSSTCTHNFAYAGTRTTGCRKLTVMISGPSSFVEIPNEIDEVFTSEGNFVFCIVRISVNPELEGDIDAVAKDSRQLQNQTFGAFRGGQTSSAVEPIAFPPFSQEKKLNRQVLFRI